MYKGNMFDDEENELAVEDDPLLDDELLDEDDRLLPLLLPDEALLCEYSWLVDDEGLLRDPLPEVHDDELFELLDDWLLLTLDQDDELIDELPEELLLTLDHDDELTDELVDELLEE